MKAELYQAWLHSHEEDSGDMQVFRPIAFDFPRSRGRAGYDFRADGTVSVTGPGASDQNSMAAGCWELRGLGELIVNIPGSPQQKLQIAEIQADKLVIRHG